MTGRLQEHQEVSGQGELGARGKGKMSRDKGAREPLLAWGVCEVGQHEDPNENPFDKAGARK